MKTAKAKQIARRVRRCWAMGTSVLSLLVVVETQAQDFTYTNIGGAIAITRYIGPGGNVTVPGTIDGLPVKAIGDRAFYILPGLTGVRIPVGVTNIGVEAFWGSTNLTIATLLEGVRRIGVDAFGGCTGLTNVAMPNSLAKIDDLAFWSCTLLSQAAIPNGVTRIGMGAFSSCSSLTSITIPPSVTELGDSAFASCTSVTSVNIENGFLGTNEFSSCRSLRSIFIPAGITSVTDGALSGTGLTNLTLPANITWVGDFAFESCTDLTHITIPDGVTYVGGGAFAFCTALGSVRIPDNVTRIGDGLISKGVIGAFSYCTSLTNVALGNRLEHIGDGAFFQCTGLGSITIPKSVTRIGDVCFAYSPNLTAVYFEGDAPDISLTAFQLLSQPTPATLYYLPGTIGWAPNVATRPTALWVRPIPVILTSGPGFGAHADGFGFRISWATNVSVAVEACTNLHNPAWEPLDTKPLTDGVVDFRDPQWTNHPSRFYRVRSAP